MNTKEPRLTVQVIDQNHNAVTNAQVKLRSEKQEISLYCENQKGFYNSEVRIPLGPYGLIVEKKGFESDSRNIFIAKGEQIELFILRKQGVPFYYRGKVKTPLFPIKDRFAIVNIEEQPSSKKESATGVKRLLKKHNLIEEKVSENLRANGIVVCKFPSKTTAKSQREICGKIDKEKTLKSAPIVHMDDDNASLLTNEFIVKFEDYVEEGDVKKLVQKHKLKVKRKISALGNVYHFSIGDVASYEIIELANKIAEQEDVIYSEPNLIHTVEEDAITPTDFLFPEQWDHQILNTPNAWQFLRNVSVNRTFGSPNVIVGVVDSGVDPNNPDFNGNVSDGSSKIYQAFDFVNMVANTNSRSSDHGTCCASAAASMTNNPSAVSGFNEGVSGVAGNCRVLAIRRGGSEALYADMYLWAAGFDPESDVSGFPAQISPGADILTNSFGFSTGSPISGTMQDVFDKLTSEGRGGKGILCFFSAGNANSDLDITFARPWGMYNKCFSVAASTLANDGVTEIKAGYSSFGSVVEFCAPSHDAYIASAPLHNPNTNFGAFTATDSAAPNGHGTVGRPTQQTTLSANANSGNNTLSVASVAGMANGQAIMLSNPGSGITEAHIITNVNAGTNQVTLNRNLFNTHISGTNVFTSAPDYRSNFGGTSHATPLAAGVAALMLSANPQLTWTQVRDILRNTAVKINPGETNAPGRWQDINGNLSNSPAYDGNPVFSEFYGFGRIDAGVAVRQAGWEIELVTTNLDFNDVPEGEEVARAVRFNVKSLWAANFNMTPPGGPFNTPMGTSASLGTASDYNQVREVYLWVTFTGTIAGDVISVGDGYQVTVTNPETEQQWDIPITANTIARKTSAIMLTLDQSGSMDFPSGIGSSKRIDVLRFSANILMDVMRENDGIGIVSFDHDPHDIQSFIGPLGPVSPFDVDRVTLKSAITNFNPNLSGNTAIGDGLERAQLRLSPVSGYDTKSIIVFTDGKETASKRISEVTDLINERVFAVGLGKASNIEPAALDALVNDSGGYMLLTNELDSDSIFKLAKYFLQILAGVNNEEIVVDPNGKLYPGQVHKIPFVLNDADISSDIILMLPNPQLIDFALETPNGQIIVPTNTIPGLTFSYGNNVAFYRVNLPVPIGPGEREGTWHVVLKVNEKYHSKYRGFSLMHMADTQNDAVASNYSGIPYTLLVHAYSSLRMETTVVQDHYEPGAEIRIQVQFTQHGIPLQANTNVSVILTHPNGQEQNLNMNKNKYGLFSSTIKASEFGIYEFRIKGNGESLRGRPFTRDMVRTAAAWRGGNVIDDPGSGDGQSREELCHLIKCLLNDKNISLEFKDRLRKEGINLDGILKCLMKYCDSDEPTRNHGILLEQLKLNYQALIKSYTDVLDVS